MFKALGLRFMDFVNYTVFTLPVKIWMLAAAVGVWLFWSSLVALASRWF